jgi:hypothetical protein
MSESGIEGQFADNIHCVSTAWQNYVGASFAPQNTRIYCLAEHGLSVDMVEPFQGNSRDTSVSGGEISVTVSGTPEINIVNGWHIVGLGRQHGRYGRFFGALSASE